MGKSCAVAELCQGHSPDHALTKDSHMLSYSRVHVVHERESGFHGRQIHRVVCFDSLRPQGRRNRQTEDQPLIGTCSSRVSHREGGDITEEEHRPHYPFPTHRRVTCLSYAQTRKRHGRPKHAEERRLSTDKSSFVHKTNIDLKGGSLEARFRS